MMFTIKPQKGVFVKTKTFLEQVNTDTFVKKIEEILRRKGAEAVELFTTIVPNETGLFNSKWKYELTKKDGNLTLLIMNTDLEYNSAVVFNLRYGHLSKKNNWVPPVEGFDHAMQYIYASTRDEIFALYRNVR